MDNQKKNNTPGGGAYLMLYLFFAAMVYAVIILLKFFNVIGWKWISVLTSIFWAAPGVIAVLLFILVPIALLRSGVRKSRIRKSTKRKRASDEDAATDCNDEMPTGAAPAVKFFEFDDPYYALIAAENIEDAINCYKSDVCELEGDESLPDEITAEEALKSIQNSAGPDDEKHSVQQDLDCLVKYGGTKALLIDGLLV